MEVCIKCKKNFDPTQIFPCDSCNRLICAFCGDLTASEIKCLQLKTKRRLKFYCDACEMGLSRVPALIDEVAELKQSLNNILGNQRLIVDTASVSPNTNCNMEDIISEMLDRQNRASNVIVFNIKESVKKTQAGRNEDDNESVKTILADFPVDWSSVKLFRLGKFSVGRNRPIKVLFNSVSDAKQILRNRNRLKVPGIKIHADETKAQRDYFHKVKSRLDELIAGGDNSKTIKFVNSKPTIVTRNRPTERKN